MYLNILIKISSFIFKLYIVSRLQLLYEVTMVYFLKIQFNFRLIKLNFTA